MTTYFRRADFPMASNAKPKWHVLQSRKRLWGVHVALCGYTYDFTLDMPMIREEIRTKSLICAKCAKKAGELS